MWYTAIMSKADNQSHTFTVVLERDLDVGGFVATCPALPGLVTEGETVEETFEMARDAIRGYLESLRKDGLTIPVEREPVVSPITVQLANV
jgi:predicted RNase H-like HicB family nuclease